MRSSQRYECPWLQRYSYCFQACRSLVLSSPSSSSGHTQSHVYPFTAEGVKAEAAYTKDKTLPDPSSTTNPEFKIVLSIIKEGLSRDPTRYTRMAKRCQGVSEETTTGVKRLYEMQVGSLVRGLTRLLCDLAVSCAGPSRMFTI